MKIGGLHLSTPIRRCQSNEDLKSLKEQVLKTQQKILGKDIFLRFTARRTGKGPVPEAVIPLCDTLICPEVLPRDQIVEVPATNKEDLVNYKSSIGKTLVLPKVHYYLVKVLLAARGPGPGGEGAPTCQWSWTRW